MQAESVILWKIQWCMLWQMAGMPPGPQSWLNVYRLRYTKPLRTVGSYRKYREYSKKRQPLKQIEKYQGHGDFHRFWKYHAICWYCFDILWNVGLRRNISENTSGTGAQHIMIFSDILRTPKPKSEFCLHGTLYSPFSQTGFTTY